MAGDSPFREAVDQVLSIKNFKDRSEWENAVQELFGSKRSPFVPMYELFLSRTEYGSFDYEEVEDEDPLLKEFIQKEDRCEYKNVYPFLEDHETAYDHFSYLRPLVLRRYLNDVRARLARDRGSKAVILVPETYDLILPPAVRRNYYRRLRTALAPYLSFGRFQVVFPSQLPFVQEEIDRVLEREGRVSEAKESDSGKGQEEESLPDEVASDELFTRTLQMNYRFATRFALSAVRALSNFSKQFFDLLADKYKNDPKKFIQAVHALLEAIFYSSALSPSFMPLFVIEEHLGETKNEYRAKAIATLMLFRYYSMLVDPYFAGLSAKPTLSLAFQGKPPIPALRTAGVFRGITSQFENMMDEVVVKMIQKETGLRIEKVLVGDQMKTILVSRIPSSLVFDKGAISIFSGPNLFGGAISITSPIVSLDFSSLTDTYIKAILNYAEKNLDGQDSSEIEELARRSFLTGFNFSFSKS